MKVFEYRSWLIALGLMLVIALTRFNHFGSAFVLPDASLAIFILGGIYLARSTISSSVFMLLLAESAAVDYYAINVAGVSDWCVTPAYGLLAVIYGLLWYMGRLYSTQYQTTMRGFFGLLTFSAVASSLAFILSNLAFYLFSGRYAAMTALEYSVRVKEYFASYILVTLFYIALTGGIQLLVVALGRSSQNNLHAR